MQTQLKKKKFCGKNAQTQVCKAISLSKYFPTVSTVWKKTELITPVNDYVVLFERTILTFCSHVTEENPTKDNSP